MSKRDNQYNLSGQVEPNHVFITTLVADEQKDKPLKCGADSQKQSKVVIMTKSEIVETPKVGKNLKRVNHLKMVLTDDLKADTVTKVVKEQLDSQVELTTDNSTSYKKLKQVVKPHRVQAVKPKNLPKVLFWVHIANSNLKRLLLDMHHQLKKEYLQYYLNEFCYKFNRRYFGEKLFDQLV
jgi:hypothetical protein